MIPHEQISDETTFSLEVVLLLISLAFSVGLNVAAFTAFKRRLEVVERTTVKKHWFANWLTLLMHENPRLNIPKPDEIKSPD